MGDGGRLLVSSFWFLVGLSRKSKVGKSKVGCWLLVEG